MEKEGNRAPTNVWMGDGKFTRGKSRYLSASLTLAAVPTPLGNDLPPSLRMTVADRLSLSRHPRSRALPYVLYLERTSSFSCDVPDHLIERHPWS